MFGVKTKMQFILKSIFHGDLDDSRGNTNLERTLRVGSLPSPRVMLLASRICCFIPKFLTCYNFA